MSIKSLSRRTFLAAAGGALAALSAPALPAPVHAGTLAQPAASADQPGDPEWAFIQPRQAKLELWGRITDSGVPMRDGAGKDAHVIGYVPVNTVLPLFEIVHAPPPPNNPHNDVWYRTQGGYLYTNAVQIIQPYHMPAEITSIDTLIDGQPGFWAEVIVPFTLARNAPGGAVMGTEQGENVVLTYGSAYHVIGAETDDAGFLWYKIDDDKKAAPSYYALARHLRKIGESDLTPVSPGVDKKIVINLAAQKLDCYENEHVVFSTLVSTGGGGFGTPKGEHAVVYKQVSRHMFSDPENEAFSDPDFFDLPGVPFNTFFTTFGHAIHGTYWHGDFGRPRSHGCVNVTPEIARFIYRWVDPLAAYDAVASGSSKEPGTQIVVE